MRIAFLLLSLAAFLFLFNGCQVCSCKKVPCPSFNDPDALSLFPYSVNQKIVLGNSSNTDTITIAYADQSPAYDADRGCVNGANACNTNYRVQSREMLANGPAKLEMDFSSSTPFGSAVTTNYISLRLYNFNFTGWISSSQGLQPNSVIYSVQHYNSVNIGGNTFSNVDLVIKDTTNSSNKTHGPYKVYLAKNQGLVAYENYPALDMWVKQ